MTSPETTDCRHCEGQGSYDGERTCSASCDWCGGCVSAEWCEDCGGTGEVVLADAYADALERVKGLESRLTKVRRQRDRLKAKNEWLEKLAEAWKAAFSAESKASVMLVEELEDGPVDLEELCPGVCSIFSFSAACEEKARKLEKEIGKCKD